MILNHLEYVSNANSLNVQDVDDEIMEDNSCVEVSVAEKLMSLFHKNTHKYMYLLLVIMFPNKR